MSMHQFFDTHKTNINASEDNNLLISLRDKQLRNLFATTANAIATAEAQVRELSVRLETQILLPSREQNSDTDARLIAELELEPFFNLSLDLLCIIDQHGYFRRLNWSWQTILGYDIKQLEGRLCLDFVHPEDFDSTIETMFELSEQKPILEFTNRYQAKNGTYRYLEWRCIPYGNLTYAAARDVTDRQQAELENQQTQNFLNSIIENIPHMLFVKDADNLQFLRFNKAGEEMIGYPREALIGKSDHDFFPPEEANFFIAKDREVLANGNILDIPEEQIQTNHQGTRVLHTKKIPILNEFGHPKYLLGISEDITEQETALRERKLIETALAESEARNRAIVQAIPDIMFRVNREGIYLSYDGTSELLSCQENQQPIGKTMANSLPPEIYQRQKHYMTIALETRKVQIYEQEIIIDGRLQHEEVRVVPIEDKDEVLFIIRDICERKLAERLLRERTAELEATLQKLQNTQAQLIQSEKMSSLGELVAGIAHEINNPVSFIYGNAHHATDYVYDLVQLLHLYQEEYPNPPQVIAEFVEEIDLEYLLHDFSSLLASIENGATRIRDIIQSLRVFSRLDESDCKAIDIHENIDSTLMILQSRFNGRDGKPEIQLIKNYGDLPRIECYGGLLNQVFVNLLMNAIDAIDAIKKWRNSLEPSLYSEYQGMIIITTSLSATNQTIISIHDNGCGMDAKTQAKIFNPFFTTKAIGQGTGMGLAISYQIITENHHGHINLSSALGKGTEITLTLPHLSLDCSI